MGIKEQQQLLFPVLEFCSLDILPRCVHWQIFIG